MSSKERRIAYSRAEAFAEIYKRGGWAKGDNETVSGAGSTQSYTEHFRSVLPIILKGLEVNTLLDAPCGDHNWMKMVELNAINYIGIDIVDQLIEENVEKYSSAHKKFLVADLASDELPSADLMLCRDLFRHIPFKDAKCVLENYMSAEIPFFLATSYSLAKNADISDAYGSRPIDLRKAPFSLPKPMLTIPDWVDGFRKRHLCLWSRKDVSTSKVFSPLVKK